MNFTPTEIMEITYKLDTNNNGFVDYTEFIAGCMKSKVYLKEENLKTAFAYFDKVRKICLMLLQDNSGFITRDELKAILSSDDFKIPDSEIDRLIKEVDFNKDNQIDYSEFIEMMKREVK